jgi:hypothetical protein
MSKSAAIWTAVQAQLVSDGRPLPKTGAEVMGTDYHYTDVTMASFLNGVAALLKDGTPSLTFNSASLNLDTCVSDNITELCGYIASATTAPGDDTDNPGRGIVR